MGQLQNLLSGTYQQPTDWGGLMGDVGGDAAFLAGLYKALGMDGGGQQNSQMDILQSLLTNRQVGRGGGRTTSPPSIFD